MPKGRSWRHKVTEVRRAAALLVTIAVLAGCDRSPPPTAAEEVRVARAMTRMNAEQLRTDNVASAEKAHADAARREAQLADDRRARSIAD